MPTNDTKNDKEYEDKQDYYLDVITSPFLEDLNKAIDCRDKKAAERMLDGLDEYLCAHEEQARLAYLEDLEKEIKDEHEGTEKRIAAMVEKNLEHIDLLMTIGILIWLKEKLRTKIEALRPKVDEIVSALKSGSSWSGLPLIQ